MKVADFVKSSRPIPAASAPIPPSVGAEVSAGAYGDTAPVAPDEPYGVATTVTPAGLEIYYQAGPKRLYRVRRTEVIEVTQFGSDKKEYLSGYSGDWLEVPSVTTVLDVLDSSGPLIWWGQGIGAIGTRKLEHRGVSLNDADILIADGDDDAARRMICDLLTEHKISTNHVKEKAGTRGTSIHTALEQWADDGVQPQPDVFPEEERGYVRGLDHFLCDLGNGNPFDIQSEVLVGSITAGFAGRYDLRLTLKKPVSLVTKIYPKRDAKVEEIPAGKYLLDLKTSKGVYPKHALQLIAYEMASIECGYDATDHRAVVHVTDDGRYEFVRTTAEPGDFLSVLHTHSVMQRSKEWIK